MSQTIGRLAQLLSPRSRIRVHRSWLERMVRKLRSARRSPLAGPQYLGILSAGIENVLEDSAFGSIRVFGHDGIGSRKAMDAGAASSTKRSGSISIVALKKQVSLGSSAETAVANVCSLCHANKEGSVHRAMQNAPPPSPHFSKTSFLKMSATRCGLSRSPKCYGPISCITVSF